VDRDTCPPFRQARIRRARRSMRPARTAAALGAPTAQLLRSLMSPRRATEGHAYLCLWSLISHRNQGLSGGREQTCHGEEQRRRSDISDQCDQSVRPSCARRADASSRDPILYPRRQREAHDHADSRALKLGVPSEMVERHAIYCGGPGRAAASRKRAAQSAANANPVARPSSADETAQRGWNLPIAVDQSRLATAGEGARAVRLMRDHPDLLGEAA